LQVFARKLVRAFGVLTDEDVLNEAHAINKLKDHGTSENIVSILHHGWMAESVYYYIDMEVCGINLEEYIATPAATTYISSENPRLFGTKFGECGMWNAWDIMEQISGGVEFIHSCEQVHRDLKPRNGRIFLKDK